MIHGKTAARAQRKAVDVESLRPFVGVEVGLASGARIGPAHRLHRYRTRRGHVLVEDTGEA